ncbi:unnamed protein product, partial [marine sediment metagenome]
LSGMVWSNVQAVEKLLVDTKVVQLPHYPNNIPGEGGWHHGWILPHFNWVSPINYLDGTLHEYVEIIERPSTKQYSMQLILDETRNTAPCGDDPKSLRTVGMGHHHGMGIDITNKGIYTKSRPLKELWDVNDLFTTGRMSDPPCMRLLNANQYTPGENIPFTDPYYFPMKVRMIWVVVSKGATFSGWANILGDSTLTLPTILEQPADTTVSEGQRFFFEVQATSNKS